MLHLFIPVGILFVFFRLSFLLHFCVFFVFDRNLFKDTTQKFYYSCVRLSLCMYRLLNVIVSSWLLLLYINTKLFLCVAVKVFFASNGMAKKYRLSIIFIIVVHCIHTHCHAKGQIISNYFIYCFLLGNFFYFAPHIF